MAQVAILLLLFLTSCGTTNPVPKFEVSVINPELEPLPNWMEEQCPPLPKLEKKELSQAEAEARWNKDVKMYHDCRTKHAATVRWVNERDAKFRRSTK